MAINSKQKKELRKILEQISTPEEMKEFDMDILSRKNDTTKDEIIRKIEEKSDFDPSYIDRIIAKATRFLADKIDILNAKKIPVYDDSELKKKIEALGESLHEHSSVRQAAHQHQMKMMEETRKTNDILVQIGELIRQKENAKTPSELVSINETLLESYKQLRLILAKTGSNDSMRIKDSTATVINPSTSDNQTTEIGVLNNIKTDADSIISNQTNGTQQTQILVSDSGMFDAFARLRTSSPNTIFDIQNQYSATGLFYENQLTGGGTVTHLPNESSVSLNVGTTSGDKVVRQSRNYFRYQPGKSQLIIMSRVFGATKTNVRKRSGYFDAQNGLFFEDNGTDFSVVQRSFVSGSAVDTRVAQSSWNIDKLDGTGASGFNLDISKANVYFIDLEWLGAGRVRFGVFTDKGKPAYCHEFKNANAFTSVYMTTANLPIRHSLENTGTAASSTSFKILCTTVMDEDGGIANPAGYHLSASTGVTATAVTTRRAVLSIRPKATFNSIVNRSALIDLDYELIAKTNDCFYELVYNATLGGTPSWTSADANSTFEYDTAGTTITGGTVLESGFIVAGLGTVTGSSGTKNLFNKFPVTLDINGANPINLSIVCTSFTGTSNISATMNWQEAY